MGSKNLDVKQRQQEQAVAELEARRAALSERGLDEKLIAKDPVFRKLKAGVRKARGRIEAIEAAEAHVKEVAARPKEKGKPKQKGKAKGQAKGGKGKQGKKGK